MGIELSAADRAGMTESEIEALTGDDAEAQLEQMGDTPPVAATAKATDPPADPHAQTTPPADTAQAKQAADAMTVEDLAAIAGDEEVKPPSTTPFRVESKDFAADRKTLNDQIDAIETKWGAGEMTDEQRVRELRWLNDAKDDLLISATEARTLANANAQTAQQHMDAAVHTILTDAKKAGTIDYGADVKAAKQFDYALTMLAADPDNGQMSAAQLTAEAHRTVMALRGIAPAAPAPAAPAAARAPAKRDVVTTLSQVPNAAPSDVDNDVLSKMSQLEGEELEEFMARLPRDQVDKIMRASDATAMNHVHDGRRGRKAA